VSNKVVAKAVFTTNGNPRMGSVGDNSPGMGSLGDLIDMVDKARLFADSAGIRQRDLEVRVVAAFNGKVKALNCEVWRESQQDQAWKVAEDGK